jgi:hypothetical protein
MGAIKYTMVQMINWSGFFGQTILSVSDNITGGMFIAVIMLLILVFASFLFFGMTIDLAVLFITPLLLGLAAWDSSFMPITGLALLYLALLFFNNFLINR